MPVGIRPRRCSPWGVGLGLALAGAIVAFPGEAVPAVAASPDSARNSVGLFDPETGTWYLRDPAGATTCITGFGRAGDVPRVGPLCLFALVRRQLPVEVRAGGAAATELC